MTKATKLRELAGFLTTRVRGQDDVLHRVADAVCAAELNFSKPDKPKASFLFLGPTGVGKTESALALAEFLFGSKQALHRFDMAEYQGEGAILRFLGETKSSQGLLGDALDASPEGSIFLFDEIEKADESFTTVFLGILDAARVTMTNGQTKSFASHYVIFTSNLGCAAAIRMENAPYATVERVVTRAAQEHFRPELYNRFKHRLVFSRLSYTTQVELCTLMLENELTHIQAALEPQFSAGMRFTYDRSAVSYLIDRGFTKTLGARPMRDTIEHQVGSLVARWVLNAPEEASDHFVHLHLSAPAKQLRVDAIPHAALGVAVA